MNEFPLHPAETRLGQMHSELAPIGGAGAYATRMTRSERAGRSRND